MKRPSEDQYSEAEAAKRRDAIVRNMIATPPAPHKTTLKPKRSKAAKSKPKGGRNRRNTAS